MYAWLNTNLYNIVHGHGPDKIPHNPFRQLLCSSIWYKKFNCCYFLLEITERAFFYFIGNGLFYRTEYLYHKWPGICSVCHNHKPVLSPHSFIHEQHDEYHMWNINCLHFRCSRIYPPPSGDKGVPVTDLVFCVLFCSLLFVLFWFFHLACLVYHCLVYHCLVYHLAIVLSII